MDHPVNFNRLRWDETGGKVLRLAPFVENGAGRIGLYALLNADREGKRSTAILLCIADRAEYRSVETQMFGDVQSHSSHWIEDLMNNSSAATKIERTKTVLPAEVIFASVDAACELSASGPLPGAVLCATGILNRQFDRDC